MPYLIGPNSAEMMPNINSATISTGMDDSAMPTTETARGGDLGEFQPLGDERLVEAVGESRRQAPTEAGRGP